MERDPALDIGVNRRPLPGRSVVVGVPDGAEVGGALRVYRRGVIDDGPLGSAATLPPDRAGLERVRREAVAR